MGKYLYQKEASHGGLNKYKIVKAETKYELNQKVLSLQSQWEGQWQKKCELERAKKERERAKANTEQATKFASDKTIQAEAEILNIENLLQNKGTKLTKNNLYDISDFKEKKPIPSEEEKYPPEPKRTDEKYNSSMPISAMFFKKKKAEYLQINSRLFEQDYELWKKQVYAVDKKNQDKEKRYNRQAENWNKQFTEFKKKQKENNSQIDQMFSDYSNGKKDAIINYYLTLLNKIKLPFVYNKEIEIDYIDESKLLVIDLVLPSIEVVPRLKKVTYVKSTSTYKESFQTESFIKKLYDKAIYDIVLLFLYDSFSQDKYGYVNAIILNGKIDTIDKTTGKEISPYILSVNISREAFNELNIEHVDSREWFKSSKGISASTFAKVTPVAPIISISHEDHRFVEGYDVVQNIDESVNLASIDWQDFENLIREVFAEEFQSNGGEVKITQASRDGGVDAIAFDPDPIRGGKIIIQAKRYTNVVGVSAVRDLYGTVMNEGATKGILVTI